MHRIPILLAAVLGLLAPAWGQGKNQASATLYTRVAGDEVRAAVVIRIEPTWYLYHTDLGHPDAIGTPTSFEFQGADVTWTEVRMDEPKVKHVDDKYLGTYDYQYHTGRTTTYAVGKRAPGASLDGLELAIRGQTCSDAVGTCVDYEETVKSSGEGPDRYWADWPADLGGAQPVEGVVTEGQSPPEVAPHVDVDPIGPPIRVLGGGGPEHVTGEVRVQAPGADGAVRAAVVLEVERGYHVYHGPTDRDIGTAAALPTVVHLEGGGVEWGAAQFPPAEKHDEYGGTFSLIHEGEVRLLVDGVLIDDALDAGGIEARVEGQVCDASGCVPFDVTLAVREGGDAELFADLPPAQAVTAAGAGTVASADPTAAADSAGQAPKRSLLGYLGLAVIWGLVTLLMPCTYPMIPITISYFTKQAISREGKVLPLSLAYGTGIVAMFILLGAVLGGPVQLFANHPVTQLVIGALFLFFALVLWGVVNLQPPRALMQMAGKASQKGGVAGVFLMGLTLVVTSFSCTAPFVGDIIARGATDGYLRPMLGMGVFGLTMAVPFVLLSLFPARLQRMPSAGEWMHVLKVSLGFVEFAAAFKFLSGADLVWNLHVLPDEVFLVVWIGVFLALTAFLFGKIHIKGETEHEIGPLRMAAGVCTLIFTVYLGYGLLGFKMDPVMTSILPGYRAERAAEWGGGAGAGGAGASVKERTLVKDDLETAVTAALAEKRYLLVNFTGFN